LDWLGNQFEGRTQNLFFSFWICCFVGAALYISAYFHLMFRRWYTSLILHILTAVYLVSSGAAIMTEIILNILTLSFLKQTQPLWSYVQMEMAGCVISFLALVRFWFLVYLNWLETSLLTRTWGFRFLEKRLGSCNISCLIILLPALSI
jgi:hypothetical protein